MAHKSMDGAFDWKKFGRRLRREMEKSGTSTRMLRDELGGAPRHNNLWYIMQGRPCCVEVYLSLCVIFCIDPTEYLKRTYVRKRRGLPSSRTRTRV
jgi:hypothetical protein